MRIINLTKIILPIFLLILSFKSYSSNQHGSSISSSTSYTQSSGVTNPNQMILEIQFSQLSSELQNMTSAIKDLTSQMPDFEEINNSLLAFSSKIASFEQVLIGLQNSLYPLRGVETSLANLVSELSLTSIMLKSVALFGAGWLTWKILDICIYKLKKCYNNGNHENHENYENDDDRIP